MWHRLIGEGALVAIVVDVHAGIQRLGHLCRARLRPAVNLGYAWNDQDMALGERVDGLEDKIFFVPEAVVDFGDCVLDVFDDGAEDAFAVREGDDGFRSGGGGHFGGDWDCDG